MSNTTAYCKSTSVSGCTVHGMIFLEFSEVNILSIEHTHNFFEGKDEVNIRTNGSTHSFKLLSGARSDESNLAVRMFLLNKTSGEYHGSQCHGDTLTLLREVTFSHCRPRGAAGCCHERHLFRNFLQERFCFLNGTKVSTDCDFNCILKAECLEGRTKSLRGHIRAKLTNEGGCYCCIYRNITSQCLNGLEDLSLISDGAERTVRHTLATGYTLGLIDICCTVLVLVNCLNTTSLHTRALHLQDGTICACILTLTTLDTLLRIDMGTSIIDRDGTLRTYFLTRMSKTALTCVSNLHYIVRTLMASELDHVNQRRFIISLRFCSLIRICSHGNISVMTLNFKTHSQSDTFTNDCSLKEGRFTIGRQDSRNNIIGNLSHLL